MASVGSGGVRRRRVEGGRPHKFTVRFTDEELVKEAARAAAANTTVPGYLALAAAGHPPLRSPAGASGRHRHADKNRLAGELIPTHVLPPPRGHDLNQVAHLGTSRHRLP